MDCHGGRPLRKSRASGVRGACGARAGRVRGACGARAGPVPGRGHWRAARMAGAWTVTGPPQDATAIGQGACRCRAGSGRCHWRAARMAGAWTVTGPPQVAARVPRISVQGACRAGACVRSGPRASGADGRRMVGDGAAVGAARIPQEPRKRRAGPVPGHWQRAARIAGARTVTGAAVAAARILQEPRKARAGRVSLAGGADGWRMDGHRAGVGRQEPCKARAVPLPGRGHWRG
jgi:hypothetical protein